jgi:hypothetical protein
MIDLITPLRDLKKTAQSRTELTPFVLGYLAALDHAVELAEVQQTQIALLNRQITVQRSYIEELEGQLEPDVIQEIRAEL